MRTISLILCCLWLSTTQAQTLDRSVFDLLNLDYPGLEKVKSTHS